jgi:hypothetical protein
MRDWKSIPKQKLLVENGEIGDCYRCCVAAVIGVPAEEVPHFVRDYKGYDADAQRWLVARGWLMLEGSVSQIWIPQWHGDNFHYPMIVSGPTVRSKSSSNTHAVVYLDHKLVYDPHPSEAGILAETRYKTIIPYPDRKSPAVILSLQNILKENKDNDEKKLAMRDLRKAIKAWEREQK